VVFSRFRRRFFVRQTWLGMPTRHPPRPALVFQPPDKFSQAEIAEPPRMQIVSGNNANRYTRQQRDWKWLFEDG
jgi:hypothetical protein